MLQLCLMMLYRAVADISYRLAAPEVVSANREKYDGKLADMWSCGVMLYVMLFHAYPFERADDPPGHKGAAKVSSPVMTLP